MTWEVHEGRPSWHQAKAGNPSSAIVTGFKTKQAAEDHVKHLKEHHPEMVAWVRETPLERNLDAMVESDLYAFAAATRGVSPRTAARKMFPGVKVGAVRAVRDLHNYAWNKITAMQCRKRGEIQTALMYEGICDRIYDKLPGFARW